MQKYIYIYESILPDSYIGNQMFEKMLNIRKGTLQEACISAAKEVISENREIIYGYAWHLENEIDGYLKECRKGQATLWEALEIAMTGYLSGEVFRNNIYTFLENYVEYLLYEKGILPSDVESIRSYLLRFVWYEGADTDLNYIVKKVDKFAKTHKLP